MAGNQPSISTTMKVNNNGVHQGPQESKVNTVSLWCHGIPEKIFQITDKVFHTNLMQEFPNYYKN